MKRAVAKARSSSRPVSTSRSSSLAYGMSYDVSINYPSYISGRDTVESVGVGAKSLPFSGSNNTIKVFRHALALDEHRAMFIPTFCTGGKPRDQQANTDGMVWDETDVKEVFFAGAHCGTLLSSHSQPARHLRMLFQTSGADL
jgi:uncharacterized protein (DUF2235 family)